MDTTCKVCEEETEYQKFLSCGNTNDRHKLCLVCIRRLAKPITLNDFERVVECPFCRKITTLPNGQESKLETKFFITLVCEDCSSTKYLDEQWWCQTCNVTICSKCSMKSHRHHLCHQWDDYDLPRGILLNWKNEMAKTKLKYAMNGDREIIENIDIYFEYCKTKLLQEIQTKVLANYSAMIDDMESCFGNLEAQNQNLTKVKPLLNSESASITMKAISTFIGSTSSFSDTEMKKHLDNLKRIEGLEFFPPVKDFIKLFQFDSNEQQEKWHHECISDDVEFDAFRRSVKKRRAERSKRCRDIILNIIVFVLCSCVGIMMFYTVINRKYEYSSPAEWFKAYKKNLSEDNNKDNNHQKAEQLPTKFDEEIKTPAVEEFNAKFKKNFDEKISSEDNNKDNNHQKAKQLPTKFGDEIKTPDVDNETKFVSDVNQIRNELIRMSGQCFEYTSQQYTYTLCMLMRTSQKPINGGSEISLGLWDYWVGEGDEENTKQKQSLPFLVIMPSGTALFMSLKEFFEIPLYSCWKGLDWHLQLQGISFYAWR